MNIKDELDRMEATKSIGNMLEWIEFKYAVLEAVKNSKSSIASRKRIVEKNSELRAQNATLSHSNKKHKSNNATLKKAIKVLLEENDQC